MNTQPEALAVADALEFHGRYGHEDEKQAANRRVQRNTQAAALLRTQHAAIERKDALLRQALAVLQDINSPAIDVCDEIAAITSELAK